MLGFGVLKEEEGRRRRSQGVMSLQLLLLTASPPANTFRRVSGAQGVVWFGASLRCSEGRT